MTALPFTIDRTVRIAASRETVFAFFSDPARWAAWWGAGSTIDARPGGALLIRYPNAVEAVGTVEDLDPPRRIVFTMGYPSGTPFPPGASRVTIDLETDGEGTRLHLRHETADAKARDQFVQGWRYQLSLFVNLVLDSAYADAAWRIDQWFAAMSEPDADARANRLAQLAAAGIEYRDRYSAIAGVEELIVQVGAMHRFMPGFSISRAGAVRHRQGLLLTDWTQAGPDAKAIAQGAAVIELAAGGRVARVTMF